MLAAPQAYVPLNNRLCMNEVFVARQPIYDRDLKVYAYELLFRHANVPTAEFIDGDQATSQVILNAFTLIGLDHLVGNRKAFVNITRGFLTAERPIPFPVDRVVLEVLEGANPDDELLDALRRLSRQGYTISLDDFVYDQRLLPLVEQADILKIELGEVADADLPGMVERLRNYNVKLLAEKIETHEQFERCRELGFDYFQGYFLERPDVVGTKSIATGELSVLRLLSALYRPNIDINELEERISEDLSLSYKLLRYLNSAFFSLPRRVDSIRQAIVLLGTEELRAWATLLALTAASNKPSELMVTLMIRAKMCELLARRLGLEAPFRYFTLGLFSGLDALLDAPLDQILAQLPLSDQMVAALLRHEGDAGQLLRTVINYQHGNWDKATAIVASEIVIEAYLDALRWADEASHLSVD